MWLTCNVEGLEHSPVFVEAQNDTAAVENAFLSAQNIENK